MYQFSELIMYLLFLPYAGKEFQVANTSTEMGIKSPRDCKHLDMHCECPFLPTEPFVRLPFCHIIIYGICIPPQNFYC